jgi:hypothetical protein
MNLVDYWYRLEIKSDILEIKSYSLITKSL